MPTTAAIERLQGKLVVAFSGGADSLALLTLVSKAHPGSVTALYVNHHLRPEEELERELSLNAANCRKLGVPLVARDVDASSLGALRRRMGTEAAARTLRYRILLSYCKEHRSSLLVAHTREDQMENVLMRSLHLAPASHLAMARTLVMEGVSVIRPVLDWSHEQLKAVLEKNGLSWSEDSTNADDRIERNRIRHQLLPSLPDKGEGLLLMADFSLLLRREIDRLLKGKARLPLSRATFLGLPSFARQELLYRSLEGGSRLSRSLIERLCALLASTKPSFHVSTEGLSLSFHDGVLTMEETREESGYCYGGKILREGGTIELSSGIAFHVEADDGSFPSSLIRLDPGLLDGALLRSPLPGDRIKLAEGERTLSGLFSSWKLDPGLRYLVPVLEDRRGIAAVFASCFGGRDRLAARCKSLAPTSLFVYYGEQRKKAREFPE